MMRRAPYTPCKLFIDGVLILEPGDYLKTPGGSAYLVQSMRFDRKRSYRRHLQCLRWPVAEIPPSANVHPLHWYSRQRRAR